MKFICYMYVSIAYAFFLLLDFAGQYAAVSNGIKYSIILILFFHSVWILKKSKENIRTQRSVINIALFCVCVADYFLLFTKFYEPGIWFFLWVQFCYRVLGNIKKKKEAISRKEKITAGILLFQVIFLFFHTKFVLVMLALEYALFSILNLCEMWRCYRRKVFSCILPLVVTFLFMCDIQVVLWDVFQFSLSGKLIWLFYVPSQVLLEKYGDL